MKEYLTKPYVEYDFSSLAILKIFEADSAIVRDVMPQTIWPLHTYPVSEALDCINWLNARKPRAQRTVINVIMTVFSLGLSVVLALPVTFSASLGQIEDLTQNISWLYWVNRIPPRALAYLQGAVPQLLVAAVVALVPSLLRYLSSWHCHVTHAQAEIAYYRYYSAFLFLQAFLLVSISSSLMVTLSEVLNKPSAIPRVLALNLPKAGNYFISFLTLQGFSLFADMIAQWAYLLKRTFKSRFLSSTPRHLAAVASQDPFSITGMYSTVALLGVIGRLGKSIGTWFFKLTFAATVYSIITPLALLPSSLGLFALLMATKPALRRFKENAAGTNGEIFSNVINQLFVGLYIMQLCLAGIFISVESKTARFACKVQAILTLLLFLATCCFHFTMVRSMKHRLLTVFSHSSLEDDTTGDSTLQAQSRTTTGTHILATTASPETFPELRSIVDPSETQIAHIVANSYPSGPDLRRMTDVGTLARLSADDREIDFYLQITLFIRDVGSDPDSEIGQFIESSFRLLHSANSFPKLKKRLLREFPNSVVPKVVA